MASLLVACLGSVYAQSHAAVDPPSPPIGRPVDPTVDDLLAALDRAPAEAVRLARSISQHPSSQALVQQTVRQVQAAWLQGQSDEWTTTVIGILEAWTGEHAAAGDLLIRVLEDPRADIRQAALEAAVRAEAVPNPRILPLIASLRHAEPGDRYRAASFLGKFGRQAAPAAGALVRAAQDDTSHAALRWEAVFALRDIGPAGVPGLIEVLQSTDRSVAYKTLDSLQSLGPQVAPAYEALVAALANPDPRIRWRAAAVLGQIPQQARQSQPLLERLLRDPDQHVRDAAAEALDRLQEASASEAFRPIRDPE
jgi:HEAT repeat protein